MTTRVSRRSILAGATVALGVVTGRGRATHQSSTRTPNVVQRSAPPADAFDPTIHGFGFRNWNTRTQFFDLPPDPTDGEIGEMIKTAWQAQAQEVLRLDLPALAQPLLDAMSLRLRIAISQRAGTNGHCYGMVLAAQQYFENPGVIPVGHDVASQIDHPATPLDDPDAPVYEDILDLQVAQFLRFQSWLARRSMLYPERIDTRAVLADVKAVVDRFGTAAVTVFTDARFGHQLLAYEVDETHAGVTVHVYEPNTTATGHRFAPMTLRFDSNGDSLSMRPYRDFTHILFNRFDRIERTGIRETVTPLDHVSLDADAITDALFPMMLVLADTSVISLEVLAPGGEPLNRIQSPHMDLTRDDYPRVRSLHGAPPGTYQISVWGHETTEYSLKTTVAEPDRIILDSNRSETIEAGQRHTYSLTIPASGPGTIEREATTPIPAIALGAGGIAAGAVGYWLYGRWGNRPQPETRDE